MGLAVSVTVGEGGGVDFATPPAQPLKPANTMDTTPTPTQRKGVLFILCVRSSNARICVRRVFR